MRRARRRALVTRPRPGHADLAGALKYDREDMRDILERASARETTARVAAGALARQLLAHLGIDVTSHVIGVGALRLADPLAVTFEQAAALPPESPLRCVDPSLESRMVAEIDRAKEAGDTYGGAFEVIARGVPVGLGSHVQWDRKLDGRLAQAMMSVPAIKAVGIGMGPVVAQLPGSQVHDEIVLPSAGSPSRDVGVVRPSNHAGGLEGGITNGEDLRVTGYLKPISTLMKPLRSVDLATMQESAATIERSDVCAITAAGVIGEAMVALVARRRVSREVRRRLDRRDRSHYAAARARIRERFAPTGVTS